MISDPTTRVFERPPGDPVLLRKYAHQLGSMGEQVRRVLLPYRGAAETASMHLPIRRLPEYSLIGRNINLRQRRLLASLAQMSVALLDYARVLERAQDAVDAANLRAPDPTPPGAPRPIGDPGFNDPMIDVRPGLQEPGMHNHSVRGPADRHPGVGGPGMHANPIPGPIDRHPGVGGPGMHANPIPGPIDRHPGVGRPGMHANPIPGPTDRTALLDVDADLADLRRARQRCLAAMGEVERDWPGMVRPGPLPILPPVLRPRPWPITLPILPIERLHPVGGRQVYAGPIGRLTPGGANQPMTAGASADAGAGGVQVQQFAATPVPTSTLTHSLPA